MLDANSKYKIGLALGGGGARGLAHIGVLKVLERENIPVCCLAGSSMGGLLGAAYTSGVSIEDLEHEILQLGNVNQALKFMDISVSSKGLFTGKHLVKYFSRKLGKDLTFEDLKAPTALQAVDLNSGKAVILQNGSVVDAMRATMSVPGFFTPVKIGGYRLIDGGVLNNVPADTARKIGAKKVIAVDVLPSFCDNTPGEPPIVKPFQFGKLEALTGSMWEVMLPMLSALTTANLERAKPEITLRPELPQKVTLFSGFTSRKTIRDVITAGEVATMQALPDIKRLLD